MELVRSVLSDENVSISEQRKKYVAPEIKTELLLVQDTRWMKMIHKYIFTHLSRPFSLSSFAF